VPAGLKDRPVQRQGGLGPHAAAGLPAPQTILNGEVLQRENSRADSMQRTIKTIRVDHALSCAGTVDC